MAATDVVFIFIFLPVSLLTLAFRPKLQKYVLLFLSLFYYACGSPKYFVLLLGMLVLNVGLAYIIEMINEKSGERRWSLFALIVGICLNIGVLFYYKYFDFMTASFNQVFGTTIAARNLLLPMGISFFIFKAISLLIDVYRGTVVLKKNPIYGALYLSFFGQIVSGPICRYNEFYEKIDEAGGKKSAGDMFSDGGYLFVKGFIKKVLLANVLSLITVEVFTMDLEQTSAPLLWLGAVSYSLQLYYDFSGYSDMAVGIGRMFGISCPKNFDYPYMTKSVGEFWRRWHITLGAWFRDYIYIPLGGSRVESRARLYFNLFIVWILTGIWHGANWTFIFWGLGYFVAIALERTFELPKRLKYKWSRFIYRIAVLAFINFQWVIFNSADLLTGLRYIKHMLIGYGYELANVRTWILLKEYGIVLVLAAIFAAPVIPRLKEHIALKGEKTKRISEAIMGITMVLLFICALSFVIAGQNNPFMYGNF